MQFVLRGQKFELTPEGVAESVEGMTPQPFTRYAVYIDGIWYPPKQVLAAATELPVAAFTTQDAYRIMHRLGFRVVLASTLADASSSEVSDKGDLGPER